MFNYRWQSMVSMLAIAINVFLWAVTDTVTSISKHSKHSASFATVLTFDETVNPNTLRIEDPNMPHDWWIAEQGEDEGLSRTDGPWEKLEIGGMEGWNRIACWPSSGGFWVLECVHPVLLDHIGLGRFRNVPRSSDPVEEDKFCKKIRKLGATHYPSKYIYAELRQEMMISGNEWSCRAGRASHVLAEQWWSLGLQICQQP